MREKWPHETSFIESKTIIRNIDENGFKEEYYSSQTRFYIFVDPETTSFKDGRLEIEVSDHERKQYTHFHMCSCRAGRNVYRDVPLKESDKDILQ